MLLRLAASIGAAAFFAVAPQGASAPAPRITSFGASETAVPAGGGRIVLFGSVSHASHCGISVVPHLVRFPLRVHCSTRLQIAVVIPQGTTATRYRFTLAASSAPTPFRRWRTVSRSTVVTRGAPQNGGSGTGTSGQPDAAVTSANGGPPGNAGALPACSPGTAFLDHAPVDPGDSIGIEPLGHMNGMHVLPAAADHVYILLRTNSSGSISAVVRSPGAVTVLQVVKIDHLAASGATTFTDYELDFSTCKSVMFWFQHIATIDDPAITSALAGTPRCVTQSSQRTCTYGGLSVPLASGERIGTAGGPGTGVDAFDFGAADIRTRPLGFIDPDTAVGVTGDTYRHGVCPLDYFTDPAKSDLYAQLKNAHPGANGIPACGTTMQDAAGTLAGNWYLRDASGARVGGPTNIAGELAIAHWNLDPALGAISTGTHLVPDPFGGAQMTFVPQTAGAINREPTGVTPDGHVYCYDGAVGSGANGPEGHFDLELTDANTLQVDFGDGPCAFTPALTSPSTYVR